MRVSFLEVVDLLLLNHFRPQELFPKAYSKFVWNANVHKIVQIGVLTAALVGLPFLSLQEKRKFLLLKHLEVLPISHVIEHGGDSSP